MIGKFRNIIAMIARPGTFDFNDEAARFYQRIGYTGVYYENDPHPWRIQGGKDDWVDTAETLTLWRFSLDPNAERYLLWIAQGAEIAHRHGLKFYVASWDPRVPMCRVDQLPPEMRGRNSNDYPVSFCLGSSAAKNSIRQYHHLALKRLREVGIDGYIPGTVDNWAGFCDHACPRCKDRSFAQRVADYYQIVDTVVRDVDPALDVIFYDWWWPDGTAADLAARLATPPKILTRFCHDIDVPIPGYDGPRVPMYDVSLAVDGPGPGTKQLIAMTKQGQIELLDMINPGPGQELFAHPYLPVPQIYYRKLQLIRHSGGIGYVDYDCGGVLPGIVAEAIALWLSSEDLKTEAAFLDKLARMKYGPGEPSLRAQAAWQAAERAVKAMPRTFGSTIWDYVGLSAGAVSLCIAVIPWPEKFKGIKGPNDPHMLYPFYFFLPPYVDTQVQQFERCARDMADAAELLKTAAQGVVDPEFARSEADRARAAHLHYASAHNWAQIAKRKLQETPADLRLEAPWLKPYLEHELTLTREFRDLAAADSLLFCNPTWNMRKIAIKCEPGCPDDPDKVFDHKVQTLTLALKGIHA